MLRLTVYLAFSSLLLVAFGQTHDDFLVCKPIEILSCPGIWFKKSCFWLPRITSSRKYLKGKTWSENLCRFYNGTLIDIESKEMYDAIYRYVQRTWNLNIDIPTWNYVQVWLASTYENGRARSSTGGEVYTKWRPGNPTTGPGMVWLIGIDQTKSEVYTGMWTTSNLNYNIPVPLCKIRV